MRITDLEFFLPETVAAPKTSAVRKSQHHQPIGSRPTYFLVLISGRKVVGQRCNRLAVLSDPISLNDECDSILVQSSLIRKPLVLFCRPDNTSDRPAPLNCLEIIGGSWLLVVVASSRHRG